MTIDAARLRALAEAATPGPWERHNGVDVFTQMGAPNRGGIVAEPFDGWQVADCGGVRLVQDGEGEEHEMPHSEAQANAAYIAAASPDAILALLDERDALAAMLREAREFWAHYSSLNEGEQDDMNAERHEMLGKMSDALDGAKEPT